MRRSDKIREEVRAGRKTKEPKGQTEGERTTLSLAGASP